MINKSETRKIAIIYIDTVFEGYDQLPSKHYKPHKQAMRVCVIFFSDDKAMGNHITFESTECSCPRVQLASR